MYESVKTNLDFVLSQVRKKPLDVANDSVRKGEDQPGICVRLVDPSVGM